MQAGESVPRARSLLSWGQGSPPGHEEGEGSLELMDRESGRSGLRAGAWVGGGDAW